MKDKKRESREWVLERRAFLRLGAGLGLSSLLMGWSNPVTDRFFTTGRANVTAVTPRASARNCILITLNGGPSHIDTFDLKEGSYTPDFFAPKTVSAGYRWPAGIMPNLADRSDKFSIVRSLSHNEAVHERAQYYEQTGHKLNLGLRGEIPHIGAVVARELDQKRRSSDVLPGFIYLGYVSYVNNGFLSANFSPFLIADPTAGISDLTASDGGFAKRRAILQALNDTDNGTNDINLQSFNLFQDQAERLMKDPIAGSLFKVSGDAKRYGDNYFGLSLAVAKNVLKADRGTRFIQVEQYGWDNHGGIYKNDNLPFLCKQLDSALSALLDDLAATPGVNSKSLLEETFIVVAGEFGRTVGKLNASNGRDHYPYAFSAIFAGGGVKGGRVIGATDADGVSPKDFGWKYSRPINPLDITTTIYSTLGIDWTTELTDTPSGRVYRYTDPDSVGVPDNYEISPLF